MRSILLFYFLISLVGFSQELTLEEKDRLSDYGPVVFRNLEVNIEIDTNGFFTVEENYSAYFSESRHGIKRFLELDYLIEAERNSNPTVKKYLREIFFPTTNSRRIEITDIEVPDKTYEVTGGNLFNSQLEIKIGDANIYVYDEQEYTIRYKVSNAFLYRDSTVDFYWNILGNNWDIPFMNVDFNVKLQGGIELDSNRYYLYAGKYGNPEEHHTIYSSRDSIYGSSPFELHENETMTLLIHLPKDYIPPQTVKTEFWSRYAWPFYTLSCVIIFVFFYWRVGKDKRLVKQVQYRAPKGVDPALAGFLIDSKSNTHDLVSLIPYWAHKGLLTIKEIEKPSLLGGIVRKIFAAIVMLALGAGIIGLIYLVIFMHYEPNILVAVTAITLGFAPGIYRWQKKFRRSPSDMELTKLKELPEKSQEYEKKIFKALFKSRKSVKLSTLEEKFHTTLKAAKKQLTEKGIKHGFTKTSQRNVKAAKIATGIALGVGGALIFIFYGLAPALVHILICSYLFYHSKAMDKRTSRGDKVLQHIIGFRMFIEKAEEPKLKFLLEEDPKYFEETIAFAVAFGMADEWCRKFNGLAAIPVWYSGSEMNFDNFSEGFNTMVDNASTSMSVTPPSSGGGGSFGGGFSGGGFGGGGGSSW